jgi:hypothetical protein
LNCGPAIGDVELLNWPDQWYKLTVGVGCLAIAGMAIEAFPGVPFLVVLVAALPPLCAFVFAHPGEMPARAVRALHMAGSLWYSAVGMGLLLALFSMDPLPRGWPIYLTFAVIGAIPCGIVLRRLLVGEYKNSVESAADSDRIGDGPIWARSDSIDEMDSSRKKG